MITSTSIGDTGYSSPENYPTNSTSADTSDFTSNVGGSDSSDNVYAHNSYEYATKRFNEILSQFDPVKDKATYDMFSRMRDSLLSDYSQYQSDLNKQQIYNQEAQDLDIPSEGYWWNYFNGVDNFKGLASLGDYFKDLMDSYYKQQMDYNQASADKAMQFEWDKAVEAFNMELEAQNSYYKRMMDSMKEAGINPLLAFQSLGSPANPSVAHVSGQTAGASLPNSNGLLSAMVGAMSWAGTQFSTNSKNFADVVMSCFKILAGFLGR